MDSSSAQRLNTSYQSDASAVQLPAATRHGWLGDAPKEIVEVQDLRGTQNQNDPIVRSKLSLQTRGVS